DEINTNTHQCSCIENHLSRYEDPHRPIWIALGRHCNEWHAKGCNVASRTPEQRVDLPEQNPVRVQHKVVSKQCYEAEASVLETLPLRRPRVTIDLLQHD